MNKNEFNEKTETDLVISEEVIATIASNTALDVDGVSGMVAKTADITKILKKEVASKSVKVVISDNLITVDLYIAVKRGYKIFNVAEEVQNVVKEAIQNMTGKAVAKVNVHICDVTFETVKAEKTE